MKEQPQSKKRCAALQRILLSKKLGGSVKFVDAIHFIKGEGIEKKQEDFAAEVAAQMNMGK